MDLKEETFDLKPSIKLQFDNDGLLLIKNKSVNYQEIYNTSKTLIKEYHRSNNLNSIKYELCKLWMLSILIKRKIDSKITISNKSDLVKLNAHVLNTFKTYMRYVLKEDPSFNFNLYFNDSEFGFAVYKIDKKLIDTIKSIII